MGVIIYGRRAYGRVHQHEGEYAHTHFAHIDFVPLFPIQSYWITQDHGSGQRYGFEIPLNGMSVAATYLRTWGMVGAIALFAGSTSIGMTIVAGVLAGLVAWSWTWRSRRGAAIAKRSAFDRVALGTRCEPRWMGQDRLAQIRSHLEAAHGKLENARPPEDVARFGARDAQEAVVAYGLLRVHAVKDRASAAAAEQLLAASSEQLPSEGGPYRETASNGAAALAEQITAAAAERTAAVAAAGAHLKHRRWFHNRWVQLAGLIMLTPSILGFVAIGAGELRAPRAITARELDSVAPPTHGYVSLACDHVQSEGWEVVDANNEDRVHEHVTFCWLGKRMVVVVSKNTPADDASAVVGRLSPIPDEDRGLNPWVTALHRDNALDAASYEVYLREEAPNPRFAVLSILGGIALGLAGWGLWIRAFVRRRRAARAVVA